MRSRCDWLFVPSPQIPSPKSLMIAVLLIVISLPSPGYCVEQETPGLKSLFHLVGVPGLRRDQRVDLIPSADGLLFKTKKVEYGVPFVRTTQIVIFRSDRRYEGRTYAATLATPFGLGSLLILKKHPVDTVVLDYVNERGGKMGIVVQMERAQGEELKTVLKGYGVSVVEPEGTPILSSQQESGTEVKERGKE